MRTFSKLKKMKYGMVLKLFWDFINSCLMNFLFLLFLDNRENSTIQFFACLHLETRKKTETWCLAYELLSQNKRTESGGIMHEPATSKVTNRKSRYSWGNFDCRRIRGFNMDLIYSSSQRCKTRSFWLKRLHGGKFPKSTLK